MTGNKVLNITHIITGDLWAGAEVQAYTLIVGLLKCKNLCLNVIVFNHGILVDKLVSGGIRVNVVSEKHNNIFKMFWQLFYILSETKAEIVHTHGYKETLLGGLAARFCNVRVIIRTYHGKGIMDAGIKYTLIEKLNNFFTDRIIAVSENLKNYLISKKLQEEIITVIHNGIDPGLIKPIKSINELKSEFNIKAEDHVIGSVGRLVPVKGHKYFLEGAKKILEVNNKVVFVVVGDGPLMLDLGNQIKKLGISNKVRFLGFRKDIIDIMNIFDIFVITSLHEGVPMVLLEAMSLAKPIIATKVGGIPEIISDNQNGLLVSAKDSEVLALVCLELLKNNKLQKGLAKAARKDIEEKYSNLHTAKKTEKLYRELL